MNPQPDSLDPLDARIVTVLREVLPDVAAIYRYGSFGGTHQRPDSDLDLAVLGQQNLDAATRLQLSDLLAAQTGCVIDLNDMRSLPVTLRVQIVTQGRRLFATHPATTAAYDSRVLSEYAELNEFRRPILDDIRARGSIYD
jgi:predicted nucleotidyltransferase